MDDLAAMIMTQGFEGYRDAIYLDTLGNPTGGYGTHLYPGRKVPHQIWEQLFLADYEAAVDHYDSLCLELDAVRKAIVVDMIYNLGPSRFNRFKRLLEALRRQDWVSARVSMVDSLWYTQVGRRSRILADMMLSGKSYAEVVSG